MIVDMHAHYFPGALLEEIQGGQPLLEIQTKEEGGRRWFRRTGPWSVLDPGLYDIDLLLKEMDRRRIDAYILSIVPVLLNLPATLDGLALCRMLNDYAAALCREHPGRLYAMATVPLAVPDAAVRELERAVGLGLTGVEIGATVDGIPLDRPELLPFFQCAAQLEQPVFIHPYHPIATPNLTEYHFANTIGFPVETTLAIAHLVHGGVLAAAPGLKVCAAHGGGFYPYQKGRLEHAWQVRQEPRKRIAAPPSTYDEGLFYDSITHAPDALAFLVRSAGAAQVLLGSDYPYDMGPADPLAAIQAAGFPAQTEALITGGNATRLFHLKQGR